MTNHTKDLRVQAGIKTAREAAEKLEISDSMIYQIEQGIKRPGPNLAIKMSQLYGCTLEDIFLPYHTTKSEKNSA